MIKYIKNFTFELISFERLYEGNNRIYYKIRYKSFLGFIKRSEIVFVNESLNPTYSYVADDKKFYSTYISYYIFEKIKNYEI